MAVGGQIHLAFDFGCYHRYSLLAEEAVATDYPPSRMLTRMAKAATLPRANGNISGPHLSPASFVIKARFEGRSRTAASLKRSPPARSEFVTADAADRGRVFPLDRAER